MKKKYKIFLVILLVIVMSSIILVKVFVDLNKEKVIKDEIKEISKNFVVEDVDNEDIYLILDRRVVTKGVYSEIENSVKLYYRELYSLLKNVTFLLDEDSFSHYLSSKNIIDDGPDFLKSRSNLSNSKAQIEENYDMFIKILNNDNYKMAYLSKDTKRYYQEFYVELSKLAISDEFLKDLENKYNNVLNNIEVYNKAFDFLYANKDTWEVLNNELNFNDAIALAEFTEIISELNKKMEE